MLQVVSSFYFAIEKINSSLYQEVENFGAKFDLISRGVKNIYID